MRKLSAKWVPKCLNADQKRQRCQSSEQLLEFFRRGPNDFLSWLMTRRQSNNQWSGGIAAHRAPKKIRWKSYRLEFLGSRRHPPHWLSSKGPNYQRGVLLIYAGAIEGHFEGKTPREGHDNAPAHQAVANWRLSSSSHVTYLELPHLRTRIFSTSPAELSPISCVSVRYIPHCFTGLTWGCRRSYRWKVQILHADVCYDTFRTMCYEMCKNYTHTYWSAWLVSTFITTLLYQYRHFLG